VLLDSGVGELRSRARCSAILRKRRPQEPPNSPLRLSKAAVRQQVVDGSYRGQLQRRRRTTIGAEPTTHFWPQQTSTSTCCVQLGENAKSPNPEIGPSRTLRRGPARDDGWRETVQCQLGLGLGDHGDRHL
jgi:hypothetical protein